MSSPSPAAGGQPQPQPQPGAQQGSPPQAAASAPAGGSTPQGDKQSAPSGSSHDGSDNGKSPTPESPTPAPDSLEAGGDAGQAPPEATDAQQRARLLQRAASMLIGGDLVGGDKFVMTVGGREQVPLARLGTQLSDPVRYAFVAPDEWPRTRSAQAGKRIAILRANPNQGKVAAAIRLLQSPADRHIYNLDRTVDLREFATFLKNDAKGDNPLPSGAGFLLCEPAGWDDVQGWMLQQLDAALELIDAQLVLTLSTGAALADGDIREYVVDLGRARPKREIFARHLAWRLEDEELSVRILADTKMTKLVEEQLAGDVSMKVAADLAVIVSQELDGAVVDLDRVRRRMDERATEDFDIWFGGLPDVPTRCLAIALAVLNGLPYETVVRAAERLNDRLDGPPTVVPGDPAAVLTPWRDPFQRNQRQLRRLLKARIHPTTARGTFGVAPVDVIEYTADDYPKMVLEHVWREFRVHGELLEWLRELAGDANEDVRTWAGTALGLLSRYAFDFVYTNALRRLAFDRDNARGREVVAYALRVPAEDSRLRPLVDAVVAALYGNRASPYGQATAARVYGISLGPLDASAALAALDRLAAIDNRHIATSIGDSLADLIMQDEQHNPPLVLDRVSRWQNDRRRSLVGQLVFLQLARALTTERTVTASDGSGERTTTWPTLLMLADQRVELRRGLIGMWRNVLNAGAFTSIAAVALAGWADLAEADADVRTALSRMLAATAAQSERSRALVRRHVADWRAVDNLQPKPKAAYAVEAALDARDDAP